MAGRNGRTGTNTEEQGQCDARVKTLLMALWIVYREIILSRSWLTF